MNLERTWSELGASWKKDDEEEQRDANLERTWVTKRNDRQFAGSKIARTGGCLELDFRDLERS